MPELVILGGGLDRRGCALGRSYALRCAGSAYLLDCGDACGDQLRPNGVDPLQVRAVFLSHMHYDHMAGLFGFLFGVWAWCRREEDVPAAIQPWSNWGRLSDAELPQSLTVAAPQTAVEPLRAFLPATLLAPEMFRFPLHFASISPGPCYADAELRLTAFPTGHLTSQDCLRELPARYPHLRLESYGFRLEADGHTLVYSGDLALAGESGVDELLAQTAGADTILTEVAHVPFERLLPRLLATPARRIILVHVHKNLLRPLSRYLQEQSDPRVILAENGMHIEL